MNDLRCAPLPLYLFAKAPEPGQVKTRMQPHLSAQQSAKLAAEFMQQVVQKAVQNWPGQVVIAYSGNQQHPQFTALAVQYPVQFIHQGDGDLGKRMAHCLCQGIDQFGKAAVMGCDVPHVPAQYFVQLFELLQNQNVIAPALDGGFYALGLSSYAPKLFDNVPWGQAHVYASVMRNAKDLGCSFAKMPMLRDIDNWQDLLWLSQHDARYLPYARALAGDELRP